MQLLCPQCGNAIAGADIDLSRGMGVCRPCGELVPFPSTVPAQLPLTNASTSLYRPESLRFEERASDEAYEVTLPPNRLATLPLLFFTLFWDGFMIVWYAISIFGGIWPMALFGLLHLGVAFHLTHKVLVGLVNTQRLRIAAGRVTFSNGPIPAGRKFDVAFDEIDGFAIAQRTSSTRNGTTVTLVLAANLAGGSERQLALTLEDRAAAEFAARRFNEVLADAKARALPVPYRS